MLEIELIHNVQLVFRVTSCLETSTNWRTAAYSLGQHLSNTLPTADARPPWRLCAQVVPHPT